MIIRVLPRQTFEQGSSNFGKEKSTKSESISPVLPAGTYVA